MSTIVENLENNKAKLTFTVNAERFEEGMQHAYNKAKGNVNIPGFRKGKVPRKVMEMTYGKEIFFEDAVNFVLPDAYEEAVKESGLDIVARPEIDVEKMSVEEGATITAVVYLKPIVKLGEYKGIKYTELDNTVTDEEIDAVINKDREKNSRIVTVEDRVTQKDDTVTIDFKGYVDDVAFEGGEATDHELVLGSGTFIDTFEDQLIGKSIDEEVIVNVTFPAEYGKEELASKPAKFEVKIKTIKFKELPEVDDDFAQDVSEFDTLEEYKKDIKTKLEEEKAKKNKAEQEEEVLKKVIENAEMEIPEPMVESQIDNMVRDFSQRLQMQGMSIEMYMQYTGGNLNTLRASYRDNALSNIKARLSLEAISVAENIQVTEEDIDKEIEKIAEAYKMEKEKLMEVMHDEEKDGLKADIKAQKALKLIIDSAIVEK